MTITHTAAKGFLIICPIVIAVKCVKIEQSKTMIARLLALVHRQAIRVGLDISFYFDAVQSLLLVAVKTKSF